MNDYSITRIKQREGDGIDGQPGTIYEVFLHVSEHLFALYSVEVHVPHGMDVSEEQVRALADDRIKIDLPELGEGWKPNETSAA